ncbi:MAG TPA: 30S ribosomal protein S1 [Candidatus Cloacimonadota bacterium]|jgi:small subunit ribosomal protein S1|nr:30S ribosomal protein S1 [Candidatus Cloacimonadota bacterium]HPM00628.1 30S ribosomal protein S1 [Candidatus Cloacimonadota bacterium]
MSINDQNEQKDLVTSTGNANEPNSMEELLAQSFSSIEPNQIVEAKVVSVTEREVLVDIGYKSEAPIAISEFNHKLPEKGDMVKVYIIASEDKSGKPRLSKKRADFILNREKLKEVYENNETIQGVLRRRVKGGMIADVLGIEAFLPGSQIALKNVPNLDQFINKEVQLKIIKIDEDKKNIIVSRKKVLEEEMTQKKEFLKDKIQLNAELDGEVKNITDYGAFIDLGGIDGLLHLTDMSWGRINHPSEMLNIGNKVKVKVIAFDEENQKISLGLKQLVPHPWENIETKYPEGTKVKGKVVNIENYGAFIEIEPGVEGLVHVSEMSWTKKVNNPKQFLKEGEVIEAIVLKVSKDDHRISLGMKQMQANPWLTIEERYPSGTLIKRKVKNLTDFGAFVEIEEDIDGLIHISDISWTKRIYHPKEVLKKGQEVEAVVLSIDKLLHRVALGIKQLHADPWDTIDETLPVNTEVKGRISKCIPKGVLVDIPYQDTFIEGFIPISHLAIPKINKPEDAFDVNEELDMKIIEIDKDNRRLILSVKAWFFSRDKNLMKEYQKIHRDRIIERCGSAPEMEEHDEEIAQAVKDENYGYDNAKYDNVYPDEPEDEVVDVQADELSE